MSRLAGPVTTIALARIVGPLEFGAVAAAMIAVSFAQMFSEAGLGKALVQTSEALDEAADVVFWTNLALSVAVYVFLFLSAGRIAVFLGSPDSTLVLKVIALQILISSLGAVQQALCIRWLHLRRLFWVRLVSSAAPAIVSIPMAMLGWGVWALVIGGLVGQGVSVAMLWWRSDWYPSRRYSVTLAKTIGVFGGWVLAEAILSWFITWGAAMAVGRYLGIADLGLFRVGSSVVAMVFGALINGSYPLLYSSLSRLQDSDVESLRLFRRANRLVTALCVPLGIALLCLGPDAADIIFGAKWAGIGVVISFVGLRYGISWMVGLNSEAYRASGRPHVNALTLALLAVVSLPVYWGLAPLGLSALLAGYMLTAFSEILIQVITASKILGFSVSAWARDSRNAIISALIMAVVVVAVRSALATYAAGIFPALRFAVVSIIGIAAYVGAFWIVDRVFVRESAWLIRRAVRLAAPS